MPETLVGVYDNLGDAEAAVNELLREGLERSRIRLEKVAAAFDPRALGYAPGQRLTSGQGAAWGLLIGAILGMLLAVPVMWLSPLAYRGVGPVLVAGVAGALVMGALLGAIGGGLAGAMLNAAPPREVRAAATGERARLTVQTTEPRAGEVLEAMRRHHPLSVDQQSATH